MSGTEVGLELYFHQMSRIGEPRNLHHGRYRSDMPEKPPAARRASRAIVKAASACWYASSG